MKKRTKLIIIGLVVVMAVALVGLCFYFLRNQSTNKEGDTSSSASNYARLTEKIEDQEVTPTNAGAFIDLYSSDFYTARDDVAKTPVANWNKTTLNEAYFLLEYYKKMQSPDSVESMLLKLEEAGQAGVNIDDASAGRDANYRSKLTEWIAATRKENPSSSYNTSGVEASND